MVESIAEKMAEQMREVSVAEFFEKNRHLLGYENPHKALLTVVKEALDNSLDACEEAGILPEIKIKVQEMEEKRYRVIVEDNGPGIVASKVPYAFAKFLYGSKFHRLKQSRGIQGLGIHGAVLYAQLTTGKPAIVTSSTGGKIHEFKLFIDVLKNEPIIVSHKILENKNKWHGVKVELEIEGRYTERRQSILEYVRQTAIANPYANITLITPTGKYVFKRDIDKMPKRPKEIKPHPYGVELGIVRRMLSTTKAKTLLSFLTTEFCRVGKNSALKICKLTRLNPKRDPRSLDHKESERLHKAMQSVKLLAPPTDCLAPLGEELILDGLKKEIKAEFYTAVTRPPGVYRGNPFQVEVGIAYGGELNPSDTVKIMRFANKVPLLYHQSDCAITKAIIDTDWRRYGLSQSSGSLPTGPAVILVHILSVWVPFTSEGKQAIADYPQIRKEIKLALQEAGRMLSRFISRKRRMEEKRMRRSIFERYIPEVANSLSILTHMEKEVILNKLQSLIKKKVDIDEETDDREEA